METELNAANLPNIGSKRSYNSVPLFRELFYNLICSSAANGTHNAKFQNSPGWKETCGADTQRTHGTHGINRRILRTEKVLPDSSGSSKKVRL